MGMSGEYLGQWAAKEPGEAWDWDAIAAEGLVGVGPGVISSALEMRGPRANYFANAPIEITDEQATETGSMGTVTRAGYSAPYQTFNDADSMVDYLSTLPNANPESLNLPVHGSQKLYETRPEAMSKLKIAISPRTPDANMQNRGTFEARDGQTLYLFKRETSFPPTLWQPSCTKQVTLPVSSPWMRQSCYRYGARLARMLSSMRMHSILPSKTGLKFNDLDEAKKAEVEKAFNKTDNSCTRGRMVFLSIRSVLTWR